MISSQNQTSKWLMRFGITSGNPISPFIIALVVVIAIVLVVTLGLTFWGQTANTRFAAAIVFMFVGGLSPIPIGLLILYSRHYVRLQSLKNGNYWVHWEYPSGSRQRDVFIGPEGLYYPDKPRRIDGFWSGLRAVSIEAGEPKNLRVQYLQKRYYATYLPPMTTVKTLFIPIPAGKEDEAQTLVTRLKKLIGQPSDFVNDQWRIGWMMGSAIIGFVLISILLLLPLQSQLDEAKFDERNATATMQQATEVAQVSVLLEPIRAVMDSEIEHLQSLPDGKMTAEEAGFDSSAGVSAVYYGHCPPDKSFYLYVVLTREALGRTYLSGPGAFNYTTASDRRYMDCGPEYLISTVPDKLDDGWYYTVIATIQSTRTPRQIDTPEPTTSPK